MCFELLFFFFFFPFFVRFDVFKFEYTLNTLLGFNTCCSLGNTGWWRLYAEVFTWFTCYKLCFIFQKNFRSNYYIRLCNRKVLQHQIPSTDQNIPVCAETPGSHRSPIYPRAPVSPLPAPRPSHHFAFRSRCPHALRSLLQTPPYPLHRPTTAKHPS